MMRRSVVFDTTVRLVFDAAMVLSVYLLFAGHNQPGGGFVGGLVAAGAFSLRFLVGGLDEVADTMRVRPWLLLAAGMALASGTAIWPLLGGGAPLEHGIASWDLWGLGHVAVASAALFDSGIYLIVVGLVGMVFEGLAE